MRTGSGVMHEEFWETDSRKRTNIELFQLWVNLPSRQKFDRPTIEYIGPNTSHPWVEYDIFDSETGAILGALRDISKTIDKATLSEETSTPLVRPRPALQILHVTLHFKGKWTCQIPSTESAIVYVRRGKATISSDRESVESTLILKQQNTATFARDGDLIRIENREGVMLDMLLLAGEPLREPVASAGPIVMNTANEVNDAYRQLEEGTFLNRDYVLKQQMSKGYWKG